MRILKHLLVSVMLAAPAWGLAKPNNKGAEDAPQPQERLTCMWRGVFHYPADSGRDPVAFDMIMINDGATIVGFAKESNTFGKRKEPYLHAVFKGRYDEKTGKVTFTKTYDGTGGEDHPVEYAGELSRDAAKVEGTWAIKDYGGRFKLERVANTRSGAFSGIWSGTYQYPQGDQRKPVTFNAILVHDGQKLVGLMKEPNTFGQRDEEPWLQATLKGRFEQRTGRLLFTKTYDGTSGVDHGVEYEGAVTQNQTKVDGTWTLVRENFSGRFTMQKQRPAGRVVDNLK